MSRSTSRLIIPFILALPLLAGAKDEGCNGIAEIGSDSPKSQDGGKDADVDLKDDAHWDTEDAKETTPVSCAALSVTTPALVETASGTSSWPALVFGTNNGRLVSVFYARSQAASAASELAATTLEPWETWPPSPGDRFVVDPNGGSKPFVITDMLQGNASLLFRRMDDEVDGLAVADLSANSPQTLFPMEVAPISTDPTAVALVRGYDSPPVGPNIGYLATLVIWDALDSTNGPHALKSGVSPGPAVTGVLEKSDPNLACAQDPIVAASVRAGASWLVLTSSGSSLTNCDGNVTEASSLAVDQLNWGAPNTVDWDVQRTDNAPGKDVIDTIRMTPTADGAMALVHRNGHASVDLVRVSSKGKIHDVGTLAPVGGGSVKSVEIVSLFDGFLVAHVDDGAPDRIYLELLDDDGTVRASQTLEVGKPVSSLTMLAAKTGDATLLGWATAASSGTIADPNSGKIQVVRVGCAKGK